MEKLNGFECFWCKGIHLKKEDDEKYICKSCGNVNYRLADNDNMKLVLASTYMTSYNYEKADRIYQELANSDNEKTRVQALFGRLLAFFGVTYIKDFNGNLVITFSYYNPDYKSITECSYYKDIINSEYKDTYIEKLEKLDNEYKRIKLELDKGIKYDVFICVKISLKTKDNPDAKGYTQDTKYADSLYDSLSKQGLKVFYSEKTLKGIDYDAQIYSALIRSKNILIISSDREYLESAWVQSEWERWVNFIKRDVKEKDSLYLFVPNDIKLELPKRLERTQKFTDTLDIVNRLTKTVKSNMSLDELIEEATYYMDMFEFDKAEEVYKQMAHSYPRDYHGWLGLVDVLLENNNYDENIINDIKYKKWLKKALDLADENAKVYINNNYKFGNENKNNKENISKNAELKEYNEAENIKEKEDIVSNKNNYKNDKVVKNHKSNDSNNDSNNDDIEKAIKDLIKAKISSENNINKIDNTSDNDINLHKEEYDIINEDTYDIDNTIKDFVNSDLFSGKNNNVKENKQTEKSSLDQVKKDHINKNDSKSDPVKKQVNKPKSNKKTVSQDKENNDSNAKLAEMYKKANNNLNKQNYKEAFDIFNDLSTNYNYKHAMYSLGSMYEKGLGVDKNINIALEYYNKSADLNYDEAINKLGNYYLKLNDPNIQDSKEIAFNYFNKSANLNSEEGKYKLGLCYYYGNGISKDYSKAIKYFADSYSIGDSRAKLGACYYNGYGCDVNYALSYYHYYWAKAVKAPRAEYNLETLKYLQNKEYDVNGKYGGKISSIYVKVGDWVKENQELFKVKNGENEYIIKSKYSGLVVDTFKSVGKETSSNDKVLLIAVSDDVILETNKSKNDKNTSNYYETPWYAGINIFNLIISCLSVLLYIIIGSSYSVVNCCILGPIFIVNCITTFCLFREYENGYGWLGIISGLLSIVSMIIGFTNVTTWSQWQWILGFTAVPLIVAISIILSVYDCNEYTPYFPVFYTIICIASFFLLGFGTNVLVLNCITMALLFIISIIRDVDSLGENLVWSIILNVFSAFTIFINFFM